jgi:hypothetical protein
MAKLSRFDVSKGIEVDAEGTRRVVYKTWVLGDRDIKRAIEAIRVDAKEDGNLENAVICPQNNFREFLETLGDMEEKAGKRRACSSSSNIESLPNSIKIPAYVLGGIGAVAGVVLGYIAGTYVSTEAAEYLNKTSALLAPVSGVTQLVGTGFGVAVGGLAGFLVGTAPALLVGDIRALRGRKLKDYQVMRQALNRNN